MSKISDYFIADKNVEEIFCMNMNMLMERLLHKWDFTCLMRHLQMCIWLQVPRESRETSAISISSTCSGMRVSWTQFALLFLSYTDPLYVCVICMFSAYTFFSYIALIHFK